MRLTPSYEIIFKDKLKVTFHYYSFDYSLNYSFRKCKILKNLIEKRGKYREKFRQFSWTIKEYTYFKLLKESQRFTFIFLVNKDNYINID